MELTSPLILSNKHCRYWWGYPKRLVSHTRHRHIALRPLTINLPPHAAGGVLVAQLGRQPCLAHVVATVQPGEAQQAGGDAGSGEGLAAV